MIDPKKWENCTDEMKMQVIKVIRAVMTDNSVTKADNKLITDFLIDKCEGK